MSDDLQLLKERIHNEQKIEQILDELGCHHIKEEQHGQLITAGLPDGNNNRSVQVRNCPELYLSIRSKGIDGNIYTLVGYILYNCETFDDVRFHLYQIKTYICNVLGYDDLLNQHYEKPKPKIDWNYWLRPIQKMRQKEIEITENEALNETILNQFVPYPNGMWLKDGLDYQTQLDFGIGFDVQSDRITIPIYNKHGQLIGIKGRIYKRELDENDLKYIYLYSCSKSIELFNLHRAYPYIQDKKQCIVVEGAKTAMFLWMWDYKNVVSIEGDRLSPVQAKLLKELGLDIALLFAWDKDKSADFIKQQTKQIKNRDKFVLWDGKNLLSDKDSPCDKGLMVFEQLYNDHLKYKIN